ncbi:dynein associated protein-domain-containing protein [Aspergillus ambiguus]|uniref:putative dynactin n=1 Tax=Aspergillus ambiguus TaxID=176160 RepID=UPI003CCDBF08
MADVSSGQLVTLTDGRQAAVRFTGTTHFAGGDWVGVELTEPTGKNDGSVQGERYFDCEPGYGMFVRPSAIAAVVEQQPRPSASRENVAPGGRARAPSGLTGVKKPPTLTSTNAKRNSATSASPTPAAKGPSSRLSVKSPTKSPTKQLSTPSSRSSISASSRPSAATPKTRPSVGAKSSMGPPPPAPATSRTSRPSVSGPATRTNRQSLQGPSATAKRPALRPTAPNKASEEPEGATSPRSADGEIEGLEVEDDVPGNSGEPSKTPRPAPRTSGVRAAPQSSTQRPVPSSALTREIDELKTKIKVMEKKRAEDREKLKNLEQLQTERDKFEGIIQKLQAKYQPQQMEIGELRKKLNEYESRAEQIERLQAEHESLMEVAVLDREMAEETADALKHECDALRMKLEELQLEVEVLRDENEELSQVMSPEEKSSQGWLQMEKANERLREALIRLRDMTQQQENELKEQIKELQQDLEDYAAVRSQYEATKEKLLVSENNVEDLKQQLETALGAEEMIEELADKNMRYQEEINELKAAIEDLEALKEINDELEYNHIETEKQLQEEIDYRESLFTDQSRKISQQDEVIEDLEYTLVRFRELVSTLQADLEDMRASQQISEAEATDLTTRSRAMMDLNLKLQASVAKAQTKTIDIELARMDAEEATQHLAMLKLYLPEYFEGERNSVLALLRFKRVSFKASLMNNSVREMVSEQTSPTPEETFTAYEVFEKLSWIAALCDRFINYITSCSAEQFGGIQATLLEMEPVERTLNFWIDGLKKNEMHMKKCAVELQRSIALLSHLAETHLPTSLETFADELCMRSTLTQSYIDHSASCISRLRSLLQSKLPVSEDGDEESTFLFGQMDGLVSQARGLKVAMGKISRAIEELRSRSLALSHDASGPFKATEEAAKELAELARNLGENVLLLASDESRTEPLTLPEVLKHMSQISTLYAAPSEPAAETHDPATFLANRLRRIVGHIEELDSLSADLSITTEFERRAPPWIARAADLKSNKATSPDAEEEIQRLKNELHEASTALGVKDETIEEQALKVELVESRMRDASKKAALAKDLEAQLEHLQTQRSELEALVDSQRNELRALTADRDDMHARLDRLKRASGTAGATTTTTTATAADGSAIVLDSAVSLATMRENDALRAEVASLQAAVRFLREESRRASILDPYAVQRSADLHSWLDVPLPGPYAAKPPQPQPQPQSTTAAESRDVFAHLLKLTRESSPACDLASAPARPAKTKLRTRVLQQREDFERWAEWRDDVVRQEREQDRLAAARRERLARAAAGSAGRSQGHVARNSVFGGFPQGLGHGMMGRAWQILGMQQESRKGMADRPVEPAVVPTE